MEFARGGTHAINTFSLQSPAYSCAFDKTTGNLAVPESNGVAIYENEQSPPQVYTDANVTRFLICTYDDEGNLFLSGRIHAAKVLVDFEYNSQSFSQVTLDTSITNLYGIQWFGKYLAIDDFSADSSVIYQVKLSSNSGTIAGQTSLDGAVAAGSYSYIYDGAVMVPAGTSAIGVNFWRYPQGGSPIKSVRLLNSRRAQGLTVSVAPTT